MGRSANAVTGYEPDAIFPPARSVNAAMRQVQCDPGEPWDADRLAAVVGVTAPTLRKNFKSSLGVSVTEYVAAVRLDRARACLSSQRESRSIGELALAGGFTSATMFTRAYLRRFGETPSQTRVRIAQAMS